MEEFQGLYRKYGRAYLNSPVSKKGKVLVCVAMVDAKLAYRLFENVL